MGIRDKPIAPRSPWQNGFAERLIGSIRRECLDQIIVCGEEHLRRTLLSYANYYNRARTHRSLNKDAPVHRPESAPWRPKVVSCSQWTASPIRPNLVFGTDRRELAPYGHHSSPRCRVWSYEVRRGARRVNEAETGKVEQNSKPSPADSAHPFTLRVAGLKRSTNSPGERSWQFCCP